MVKVVGAPTKVGTCLYRRPSIDAVQPSEGPVRGGTPVTWIGNHVEGTTALTPTITLTTEDGESSDCRLGSATERTVSCVTADHVTSGIRTVAVNIDGVVSVPEEEDDEDADASSAGKSSNLFLPPQVDSVTPGVLPTYGGTIADDVGKSFGDDANKLFVSGSDVPCIDLNLVSAEHLRGAAPPNRPPTELNQDQSHEVTVTYNKARSIVVNETNVRYKASELKRGFPARGYR